MSKEEVALAESSLDSELADEELEDLLENFLEAERFLREERRAIEIELRARRTRK